MLCKKTIERGCLWHCCNLFAMVMADGLQLKGFHLWVPFLYLPQNSSVCVALLWNVRNIIGRPSAAVGADLSCPRIYIHPRNGKRKRIFDNVNIRV